MTRKSKAVPLVLLGSSLILSGCIAHKRPCTTATQPEGDGVTTNCTGGRSGGGGGYYYHHSYWPWGYSYGSGGGARQGAPGGARPGAGAVRSGGFGGVGHAVSGGS
jgi:hypothetical protein